MACSRPRPPPSLAHLAHATAHPTSLPLPARPQWEQINISVPLTHASFEQTLTRYSIVVVNFFAPW